MSSSAKDPDNKESLEDVRDDSYSYADTGGSIYEDPSFMSASTLTQDATLYRERNINLVEEPIPRGIGRTRSDPQRKITFQEPEEVVNVRRRRKLLPECLLTAPPWVHGVLVASIAGLMFTLAFFIAARFFMNDLKTESPTFNPSSTPSIYPSTLPTDIPTLLPTMNPTKKPSSLPSLTPSQTPSFKPSAIPSIVPSNESSLKPSVVSTTIPPTATNFSTSPPTFIETGVPTSLNSSISRSENALF